MFHFFQQFPLYSQLENSLLKATDKSSKSLEQFDICYGEKHSLFIQNLGPENKEKLERIISSIREEKKFIEPSANVLIKAREELSKIKTLNESIKNERKVAKEINLAANKSENKYLQACNKLERIKNKSGEDSDAFKQQIEKVNQYKNLMEANSISKKQKDEAMAQSEYNYKKELINSILLSMQMIAETRFEAAEQNALIGQEIDNIADDLIEPEDASLNKLERELSNLDTIKV